MSTVELCTESASCTAAVRFCNGEQKIQESQHWLQDDSQQANACTVIRTFSKRVGPSVLKTSFHKATATMKRAAANVAGPRYLCHEGLQCNGVY